MTITARMAEWVAKHRILVYALATLALMTYLVLAFSPAEAAGAIASPKDIQGAAQSNCAYLTFCRWDNLSQTGQPPIIGMPELFIVNIMFLLGHFLFFILGQTFIFVSNLNIYHNLLYFGDGVFAKVSVINSGGGVNTVPLIMTVVIGALVVLAFTMVAPSMSRRFSATGSPIKTAGWMLAGIVILSLMSTASARNHSTANPSPIGRIASGTDSDSIGQSNVGEAAKDPAKWAPFSLGWAVAWGDTGAKFVGDIGVNIIGAITNSIAVKDSTSSSACSVYIDSMHDLYAGGDSAKLNNGVLGIEKLYRAAVLDQYVISNFGDSVGAQNAWCRVLEVNKPVAEQVLIAKNAEKLTGSRLYAPALDVMINSDGSWVNADTNPRTRNHYQESSILGYDAFKHGNFGAGLATSYFAPPPSDSTAMFAHRAYFAACQPSGNDIVLNPEWVSVQRADTTVKDNKVSGGETLGELSMNQQKNPDGTTNWKNTTQNICNSMATGSTAGVNVGFGTPDGYTVAVGFWDKASDATGDHGSNNNGKTDFIKRMSFKGAVSSTPDILALLFSGQDIDQSSHFVAAQGGLSGPAYNYYATSTGINWGSGFLDGAIMLFVSYLIARMAFPIVVGGAMAQFFSATIMMVLALLMLGAVLWPTRKIKTLNIKAFAVIVAGSLVSTMFTAIFLVYAGLFSFVNSVLTVRQATTPLGTGFNAAANGIALLLAGLISYSLMKILLAKTLNFDPTNFKSAMSTATNAVFSPMSKGNEGGSFGSQFKGAMAAPFQTVGSLVKTPIQDTKSSWSKLKDARDNALNKTSDQLKKRTGNKSASEASPQSATSTSGSAAGSANEPLVGVIIDPKGARPNGARPHGGSTANNSTINVTATATSASAMTDEQHRQRLMDQVKNAYGTAQADKVFPNGIPADFASTIAKAPIEEIKRLSKMLDARVEGSDGPRATQQQAADNIKKFNAQSEETLRQNPNGFDSNVGYAERAATQAEMFRGVHPFTEKDMSTFSDADKKNFEARKFDLVGGSMPEGRAVSFGSGADVIKGEVVSDPLTSRSVPNAIVRSGSQNTAPLEGVTQDGTSVFGAKRTQNADGTTKEDWGLSTLDSGARQLPPSVFDSAVAPAGATPEQWEDVSDLHGWIKDNNIQADSTAMSTWPAPRREQADRVADVVGNVMSAQGVPMVDPEKLESLAEESVGMTGSDSSFTYGEKTPKSDFSPTSMRDALTKGKDKMSELESASMKRAELLMDEKIRDQVKDSEGTLKDQERDLEEKLNERSSLVKNRAESQLAGLLESLAESNEAEATEIAGLLTSDRWDEITELLNEDVDDDEAAADLKAEIRSIVDNSRDRIDSLNRDHQSNIAQLYAQLADERESITEAMHREIEAELQNDIERNSDSVRELAFSGASETSKRHVEGMLSWFPAIKSKFFSGNTHADHEDIEAMEDADGDGIDDRQQINV